MANLYETFVGLVIGATESGVVPDYCLRYGIRHLLSLRAIAAKQMPLDQQQEEKMKFVDSLKQMPVAINTSDANDQHYELPTEYFQLCLGKHLKYSSCLYNSGTDSITEAEVNMLALYCKRAKLEDGQDMLELGCGWGSLSLFVANAYRNSNVTAVSNSNSQREFIMARAAERGLTNLKVITANMVDFEAPSTYDRVLSVEMFEHMKNYNELMRRISTWLKPGGKLFVHIFVHKTMPYHFEVESNADWMSKYFFTGGTMPSNDLLLYFQQHLALQDQWYVNGTHYSKTLEAWLQKQDAKRDQVMGIFEATYPKGQAGVWYHRWRMFYISCSELFNYNDGNEWGVGHYLFTKK